MDLGTLKSVVSAQLARFDLVVANKKCLASIDCLFSCLDDHSLVPKTIFDVGVADGTPWLYRAFPAAKYHLVDPTRESLPYMRELAEELDAEIHNFALGAEAGVCELAKSDNIGHASLLRLESDIDYPMDRRYEVPVHRFDAVFGDFERPALCKIDVEGAELMVLKGMGERIRSFEAIIVETSVNSLFKDGPELRDIIAYMTAHNFSLFDIGSMMRRPWDDVLHLVDAIFVPDDSRLRTHRNGSF